MKVSLNSRPCTPVTQLIGDLSAEQSFDKEKVQEVLRSVRRWLCITLCCRAVSWYNWLSHLSDWWGQSADLWCSLNVNLPSVSNSTLHSATSRRKSLGVHPEALRTFSDSVGLDGQVWEVCFVTHSWIKFWASSDIWNLTFRLKTVEAFSSTEMWRRGLTDFRSFSVTVINEINCICWNVSQCVHSVSVRPNTHTWLANWICLSAPGPAPSTLSSHPTRLISHQTLNLTSD